MNREGRGGQAGGVGKASPQEPDCPREDAGFYSEAFVEALEDLEQNRHHLNDANSPTSLLTVGVRGGQGGHLADEGHGPDS
jgi:hypothetical protein